MFEQAAGELHAKLMIDSHNWAAYSNPGPGRGAGGWRQGLAATTQTISTARLEAAARPAGPGRASSRRAELKARSADGERAGRPRGGRRSGRAQNTREATSSPAHRTGRAAAGPDGARNTSGATSTSHMTTRVRQRGGYRSTRLLSAHSATASSRLRPIDRQSWRRRRIHRNMPPTTAAPRPAPPIRPSKPVRARRCFRLGLVAGTSGAT